MVFPPGSKPLGDFPPGSFELSDPLAALPPGSEPVSPDELLRDDEARRDAEVQALFGAAQIQGDSVDRRAGILSLNKQAGVPIDIALEHYDDLRQSAERAEFDPRRWRAENPSLYRWLAEDPRRATISWGDEAISKYAARLRLGLTFAQLLPHLDEPEGSEDRQLIEERLRAYTAAADLPDYLSPFLTEEQETQVKQHFERFEPIQALQQANPARGLALITDAWGRNRKASERSALWAEQRQLDRRLRAVERSGNPSAIEAARQAAFENELQIRRLTEEIGPAQDYAGSELLAELTAAAASQVDSLQALGVGGAVGATGGAIVGGAIGAAGLGAGVVPGVITGTKEGAALGMMFGSVVQSYRLEMGSLYGELRDATDEDGNPIDPEVVDFVATLGGAAKAGVELVEFGLELDALGLGALVPRPRDTIRKVMSGPKAPALVRLAKEWAKHTAGEATEEGLQQAIDVYAEWGATGVTVDLGQAAIDVSAAGAQGALGGGVVGPGVRAPSALVRRGVSIGADRLRQARARATAEAAQQSEAAKHAAAEVARLIELDTERTGETVTHLYADPQAFVRGAERLGLVAGELANEVMGDEGGKRLGQALAEQVDADGMRATLKIPVEELLERWGGHPILAEILEDLTTRPGSRTAREQPASEAALAEEAREVARAANETPASLPAIREAFDALPDDTARAAEFFRDPTTGLRNERGLAATAPDPGRPFLAVFDLEGGKILNDRHGHEVLDGGFRTMAETLTGAGLQDGAKVGGSVLAYVRDEAHARELAQAMRQAIDPRLRVTYGTAERQETFEATREAAFNAAGDIKTRLRGEVDPETGRPKLGHRKLAPAALSEGLPEQVSTEKDEPGVPIDAPEVQSVLERAAAELAPTAERLRAAQPLEGLPVSQELLGEFNRRRDTALEQTYLTRTGAMLNYAGRLKAQELNPKQWTSSADLRGFAGIDKGLRELIGDDPGRRAADAINDEFERAMAAYGAGEFDAWHQSGDEYGAHHDSKRALRAFWQGFADEAANTVFVYELDDGRLWVQPGLYFAVGTAPTFSEADSKELPKAKKEQDARDEVKKPFIVDSEEALRRELVRLLGEDRSEALERVDVRDLVGKSSAEASSRAAEGVGDQPSPRSRRLAEQQADATGRGSPLFRSPAEMGVPPREYESYLRKMLKGVTRAALAVERREAQLAARMATAEWQAEVDKNLPAARAEWEQRRDWRAFRYIKRGEIMVDGTKTVIDGMGKIDRAEVRALMGEDVSKRDIEPLFRGRIVKHSKTGVEPVADVAERMGFDSPAQMFEEVLALPADDGKAWTRDRAEELTREAHPEIIEEMRRLRDVADETLHNEGNSDWLLDELAAARRRAGGGVSADTLRASAELTVAEMPVGFLPVGQTARRELAAANEATVAAARREWRRVRVLKEQQVLASYQHKEMIKARRMREKFEKLAKKLGRDDYRGRLGTASPAHRDVVDSLLEGLGIVSRPPDPGAPAREGLESLIRTMEEHGDSIHLVETDLIAGLLQNPRSWKDLQVQELRKVLTALEVIRKSAHNRNTSLVDGRRVEKEATAEALVTEAADNLPRMKPAVSSMAAMTARDWVGAMGATVDGYNLKPQTMAEWLGGGGVDSMWYRAIIKPLQEGKHAMADIMRDTVRPIAEKFEEMPKAVRVQLMEKVDGHSLFPDHRDDLQPPTRRVELLMMALHRGTLSSIERLTLGRGITLEQVDSALATLSKEELAWVQTVWDAADSLWAPARELEERDAGVAPEKLAASPFTVVLADGTEVHMRGGYFPAVYDRRVSATGEKQAARDQAAIMDPSFTRIGTSRSHLRRRAENFSDALSLEPSTIQLHLVKVAHDLAYRERLRSVYNLISHPKVEGALRRHLGEERARHFVQWLKDIGGNQAANVDAHAGLLARSVRKLRSNAGVGILGYAIDNFIADTVNIQAALHGTDLQARHLAVALQEYAGHPGETRAFVTEHSGEIRTRSDDVRHEFEREIKAMTRSQRLPARAIQAYKDNAWWVAEQIDIGTSTPVWLARYRQGRADGRSHDDAVMLADNVIQQVFPSRSPVDMSALQRDRGFLGQLSFMAGYLNVLYNIDRRHLHTAFKARGVDWKQRAGALGNYVAGIVSTRVFAEWLVGRGPEKDDGEDEAERWMRWFMRKMLVGTVAPMPMVGGMVESWALGRAPSIRLNPGFAVLDGIGRASWRVWKGGGDGEAAAWAAARAVGLLRGYPTRPMRWVERAMQGEELPEIFYGERTGKPLNPLSTFTR